MITSPARKKIDAVAGAVVDAQLTHTFTDRRNVAGIAGGQSGEARCDQRFSALVLELPDPFLKGSGLELHHVRKVFYKSHIIKGNHNVFSKN